MATVANIYTPRMSHKLWPRPASHSKFTFAPKILGPYAPPPPPPPLKKPPPPKAATAQAEELGGIAEKYRAEADELVGVPPRFLFCFSFR